MVDGCTIPPAPGDFVGCVLLGDDHLMGGREEHIMKAWRDEGRGSSLESGTSCCRTGRPFSEDAMSHSCSIAAPRLT